MTGCCIIVGAGPGIGAAVARRFGQAGFPLALISRRPDDLAGQLGAQGHTARSYAADAGDEAALTAAIEAAQGDLGPAGVLVYNAAALVREAATGVSAAQLLQRLSVSVGGALTATRAALPGMRAARSGTILMTGGGLALHPSAAYATLSVGKAALRALALTLAEELAPDGIHVATVTVAGTVKAGTPFDPDRVAQVYWDLHAKSAGQWKREVVFDGK